MCIRDRHTTIEDSADCPTVTFILMNLEVYMKLFPSELAPKNLYRICKSYWYTMSTYGYCRETYKSASTTFHKNVLFKKSKKKNIRQEGLMHVTRLSLDIHGLFEMKC